MACSFNLSCCPSFQSLLKNQSSNSSRVLDPPKSSFNLIIWVSSFNIHLNRPPSSPLYWLWHWDNSTIASIMLGPCLWFIKGVKTSTRPIRAALIIQSVTGGSWDLHQRYYFKWQFESWEFSLNLKLDHMKHVGQQHQILKHTMLNVKSIFCSSQPSLY